MRISLILLFCFLIVVVNSATSKTTRRVVANAGRGTSKAPIPKSAYTYLRSIRGTKSCAGGLCPFWERHGRSFVSLRCYAQQYRECTCLHRMCFSSCMFTRQVCNEEMASCLKQICPRCMPASASAMCKVYDSMADKVAEALSVFACYPCCPVNQNSDGNTTAIQNTMTVTTTSLNNIPTTTPGGNSGTGTNRPLNGNSQNTVNTPINGGNAGTNPPNAGNGGNTNGGGNTFPGVFPGSGAANTVSNNNNNAAPIGNQRVKKTVRPTAQRVVTTRRTPATTRRTATVRGNNVKSTVRTAVQAQKKPQTNNGIKN